MTPDGPVGQPCPPGCFSPGGNTLPCMECPSGLGTDDNRTACGHGYIMTPGGPVGQPCPPDWFSPGGSTLPCMECPSGLGTDDNRTACGEDVMAQA
ncbi:hypothetical protein OEZ85_003267 [Tetradesmus obliquus]|uniref:Tyrosine-protein kinase ephrin type A/B receptor-like domain-containing protein n=1 Tax=Tetradesmus obliquus TaxID=3088 RepID=A0ABY8U2D1_TETOB|nr:hypothetical protein OEZ85_003267 [Tetradesmus obliquus]